jgi:exodeoxyribonuclease VII large subunit
VQGEDAKHEIVRAIKFLNEHHKRALSAGRYDETIDVMIVGRGGGSIEDLWAFNEEVVARAIRNSAIPVISAVGHETDFTIADFVADRREPTPSAAAETVAAHEQELCTRLASLTATLARSIQYRIVGARNHVQELALSNAFDAVAARVHDALTATGAADYRLQTALREAMQNAHRRLHAAVHTLSPAQLRSTVKAARARFDSLAMSHDAAMLGRLNAVRQKFAMAAASLDAMSPLKVLERGYAIAQDEQGSVVRDSSNVAVGDELHVRLWKGALDCRVEKLRNEPGMTQE